MGGAGAVSAQPAGVRQHGAARVATVGVARMQSGDCWEYAKAVAAKAALTSLPHLWEGL